MKYYVKSNDLAVVICGPHITTTRQAACEAFLTYYNPGMTVAPLVIVSERGFDYHEHNHHEDNVFDTMEIMNEAGV